MAPEDAWLYATNGPFCGGYFLPVGADAVLFSTCGLMCLRAVTSTTLPHFGHTVDVTAA